MDDSISEKQSTERIIEVDISDEVKKSYLSYAMSVIVGRALPDVRDGLKPVHRRILYAMHQMALWHNKPYKKSARVVGEVLGKFHPHGDQAIYDALVRMAQDFSMNLPLIDGHGNFGSVDGDSPAAMRYTEVRLSKAAELLLEDIDKDTVDFVPNFDGTLKEPLVLPSRLPNLLVNGSLGIAVGMATNIPPHNLGEVVDALIFLIDNRARYYDLTVEEIMQFIKGPDFPTGGIIYNGDKIKEIYETGRGTIEIWSKVKVEDRRLIIEEIPYMVNKAKMIEEIANLIKEEKIKDIKDIRDESNRDGIRVVIELKSGANPDKVLASLYSMTSMKYNFPVMCVALRGLEPKQMSLKEMLWEFINHRFNVVLRRSKYELTKAKERKHILDGLRIAIMNIDRTVEIIKSSKDREEAKERLMREYEIDEIQSNAILDMPLGRLTNLEVNKLLDEIKSLEDKIAYLEDFISNENKIYEKIKEELSELKKLFSWQRRTEIFYSSYDLKSEVADENEYLIVYTTKGYIKKISSEEFRTQKRGGKGVNLGIKDDTLNGIIKAKGTDKLLVISNKGKAYNLDVSSLDLSNRYAKGRTIFTYIDAFDTSEKIVGIVKLEGSGDVIFLSKQGIIKRSDVNNYTSIRRTGIIALTIRDGDEVVDVCTCDPHKKYVLIFTSDGKALKFSLGSLRQMGRVASGVKGINLRSGDAIKVLCVNDDEEIILVSSLGYGKKLHVKDIPVHGRGTGGVRVMKIKDGERLSYIDVVKNDALYLFTANGMIIKIHVKTVPHQGRNSRGVRIIKVKEEDKVVGGVVE